ncbi:MULTISPECIES: DsbA family protein [unclassified Brevundimonas]|jgi:protein-disulfide isomerase|uniref:DsbA family protein n=1 Tax=unclassified Brevundimonas TaxID=2622653 RepID=UPI0025BB00FB|nr:MULTISPECIES: DsbA family protein [unclassified Brevundimonas]
MATFRYASMSRRAALTAAALAAMATVAGCTAKTGGAAQGDMGMGAGEDAKVTVVEYASVTCGHCAVWNEEVWPEFKTKYVDTKKVRYVFREFPTPPQDIAVAGFLIARCAGPDKYFDVVHDIMASQKEWMAGVAPRTTLFRAAAAAGLSQEQTEACISDKAAIEEMSNRIKAGIDAGVTGTPTFLVNGTKVLDSSLSGLSEAIDAELAKK